MYRLRGMKTRDVSGIKSRHGDLSNVLKNTRHKCIKEARPRRTRTDLVKPGSRSIHRKDKTPCWFSSLLKRVRASCAVGRSGGEVLVIVLTKGNKKKQVAVTICERILIKVP